MADDNGYYGKKQRMKDLYADLENDDKEELYYTKKYRYVEKVTGDLYEEDEDDNRGRRNFRTQRKSRSGKLLNFDYNYK